MCSRTAASCCREPARSCLPTRASGGLPGALSEAGSGFVCRPAATEHRRRAHCSACLGAQGTASPRAVDRSRCRLSMWPAAIRHRRQRQARMSCARASLPRCLATPRWAPSVRLPVQVDSRPEVRLVLADLHLASRRSAPRPASAPSGQRSGNSASSRARFAGDRKEDIETLLVTSNGRLQHVHGTHSHKLPSQHQGLKVQASRSKRSYLSVP